MELMPHERTNLFVHYCDVTDASGLCHFMKRVQLFEVYNLAAGSYVRVSFDQPKYTSGVVASGTLRLLHSFRAYAAKTWRMVHRCASFSIWLLNALERKMDDRYFSPTEPNELRGDPSKIERALGARPRHSFENLARLTMEHDLESHG
jgi:GDP-D-mannose dehydratase